MLTQLSDHQKAQIPKYRQKSMDIGLSTGPVKTEDKPRLKELVDEFYTYSKLNKTPEFIMYVQSPRQAIALINYLKENEHRLDEHDAVFNGDTDKFVAEMLKHVPEGKMPHHAPAMHGNHETHWLQYYDYYRNECADDVKYEADKDAILTLLIEYSKMAGWLYTFERVAIITDRPSEIHMQTGSLHCEDGPAIAYADGFGVYAVGGHRIDGWIIDNPELITIDKIKNEGNAETKRIMIDKFGVDKYLFELDSKILDVDSLGIEGSSTRTLIQDDEGEKWLIATDGSTGRVYHMAVPEDVKTCTEAHSRIAGFDSDKNCSFEC